MSAEAFRGATGEPLELEYPAPLFVRNTFIEAHPQRSPSFEEFFQERKVRSCPTSGVDLQSEAAAAEGAAGGVTALAHQEGSDCSTATPRDTAEASQHKLLAAQLTASLATQVAPLPVGLVRVPHLGGAAAEHEEVERVVLFKRSATWGGGLGSASVYTAQEAVRPPLMLEGRASAAAPAATPASASTSTAGSPTDLPSVGSAGHETGRCKPCAFFNTKGCESGADCRFCHLCEPGEKKKRRKEKLMVRNTARQMRRLAAETWHGLRGTRPPSDTAE